MTDKQPGLYIHVPFCNGKCPYCDFYSLIPSEEIKTAYTREVISRLDSLQGRRFATVYFGGGTPSQLGADNIAAILNHIDYVSDAEITVECNPSDSCAENGFNFIMAAKAGVNRISMGLQSAVDIERKALGRRAGTDDAMKAIHRINEAGINNISLDLMLGIPGQTAESLSKSIGFCISAGIKHISAYMLKIEEGTPFGKNPPVVPEEDEVCELYLQCCRELEKAGFKQYEISNFALPGFESRHNLIYWHCDEYLGIGPAAHSFLDGKRFYFERNLDSFIAGAAPVDDGNGGGFEEYAMLALRLTEGLCDKNVFERFGFHLDPEIYRKAEKYVQNGMAVSDGKSIHLTPEGFLLSNTIIADLII